MADGLAERYDERIVGVLSSYDWIIIRGTLPGICYAKGMTAFLRGNGIRIFDRLAGACVVAPSSRCSRCPQPSRGQSHDPQSHNDERRTCDALCRRMFAEKDSCRQCPEDRNQKRKRCHC